jgi:hypothetical protein
MDITNPNRHLISVSAGILAGYIPNNHSNIHPLLMGAILAILLTKILIGDYDRRYQWTYSDFVFGFITACEGMLGALIARKFP